MRSLFVASLSSLFLAVVSLSGCASEPKGADDDVSAGSAFEEGAALAELAGDYRPLDGGYPRLALEADGTYQFDTGVRCLRAPCPSGDAGTWRLRWGSTLYLVANTPDALEPQRFLDIVSTDPLTLVVEGAGGEARELAKFVEAPAAASCAAVLCAAGRRCEIVDGAAQCVP